MMLDVEQPNSQAATLTQPLPADLLPDATPSHGPPQRVLVVEDMDDSRASLVQLLEMSLGLEVDAAENGALALEMLAKRNYSLVVTDLRMPKVGGMKLIHEIRDRQIPVTIIVTTGHGSIKDAVDAMRLGAYDFLPKPADPQHLCLLVRKALKDRELLDEVGDIPPAMQVKLLRVLQDRRFERLGGTEPIEVDVRVIAATHQPIEKLVRDAKFRDDLYYRLNVVRVDLPPLRERPEDIPLLVQHFCQRFARPGKPPSEVSPEAMEVLLRCPWPGNVRQLENAVERACVTARDGVIRPHNLPPDVTGKLGGEGKSALQADLARPLPEQLAELTAAFEERYLRKALRKTRGHVGKCATLSGLSRRSITDKITLYKIDKEQLKRD